MLVVLQHGMQLDQVKPGNHIRDLKGRKMIPLKLDHKALDCFEDLLLEERVFTDYTLDEWSASCKVRLFD